MSFSLSKQNEFMNMEIITNDNIIHDTILLNYYNNYKKWTS